MTDASLFDVLAGQMADAEAQWSLGTFGAIAEFSRDPGEPVELVRTPAVLSAATMRGGIRIALRDDIRPIAFETTTRESWSHRVALCLPEDRCLMGRRAVLTELGPDGDALRAEDRDAILFDLGLDRSHVDLCVRVADPATVARLRACVGRAVFEAGNPAMGVILAASPHRVFVSRLGRIEVRQPIPSADGTSPEGPHTHVLPKLLHHRRTHAATEPIPDGWVPCAHLYPAHPARDHMGRGRPFDAAHHDAFQRILGRFGDPAVTALKQRVVAAVNAGEDPSVVAVTNARFARTNVRVALRQLKATHTGLSSLPAWMAAHEPSGHGDGDDGTDAHEHR
jgi:hypothetical protein